MIATIVAALHHGRSTELATPKDERVVQQSALFQVHYERGTSTIGIRAILLEICDEVAVLVPSLVVELNEADTTFDEPPG
jgi:hypothetical protein